MHTIDAVWFSLFVNGHRLKLYKKPLQHDGFIFSLIQQYGAHSEPKTKTDSQSPTFVLQDITNMSGDTEVELHNSTPKITQA